VTVIAKDAAGNTTTGSFTITVQDTAAPALTVPTNIVAEATSASGTAVTYAAATATDAVGVTSLTYSAASGSTFALGATAVTVTAKDAAGNTTTGSFTVTVMLKQNATIGKAVVLARNSVWLKQKSEIHSGDVMVDGISSGPYLSDGVELSVGQNVTTPAGFALKGNRISIRQKSTINSDVFFNDLDDSQKSTIAGQQHTPLSFPLFAQWPQFETAAAGTQDIVPAQQSQTVTLNAGSYRDVVLKQKSTLILNGGTYNLRNLDVGQDTKVLFKAASIVRIAEKFALDQKSILGPDTGSGISAKDIILYVNGINGINGNTGKLGSNPDAAKQDCTVQANFYVPNGTLAIEQKSNTTGAFLARDVMVGENVELNLASRFGPAGGAALASLPSRAGGGQLVVPLVTRVQKAAEGAMDLLFNGNPGSAYSLQTSQDLRTWENLAEVLAGPDGAIQFTDSAASELRHRFYRVVPAQSGNALRGAGAAQR
jgi:hypothetical protein